MGYSPLDLKESDTTQLLMLTCFPGGHVYHPPTPPGSAPGALEQEVSAVFASSLEPRLRVPRAADTLERKHILTSVQVHSTELRC